MRKRLKPAPPNPLHHLQALMQNSVAPTLHANEPDEQHLPVVPAQAGTHAMSPMSLCYGFPPQSALECFSRGRERQCWC